MSHNHLSHLSRLPPEQGIRVSIYSIVINFLMFIVKLIAGLLTGSLALVSDAFHTLSDCATSGVVLAGLSVARKGPDSRHPHGHGRAELVSALILSILLGITGIELLKSAVERLFSPVGLHGDIPAAMVIVVATILIKEWMARYTMKAGVEEDSLALKGDAWHHRSDALTSVGVLISLAAAKAFPVIDPLMGIIISGVILYIAFDIGRHTTDSIIGTEPSPELLESIRKKASSVPGVRDVHGIEVHDYGTRKEVSFHIRVDPEMSVRESHRIATMVEEAVSGEGIEATVHVEPGSKENGI